ncbi:hypothetical protein MesoLjLc_40020 [Mesorhizobium sp. L-8-10]|nr:hypothetical protein MesoLjLc_40020 [Mesorhizobium sp. L-8-10]
MQAAARQEHGIAGIHDMDAAVLAAQQHGPSRDEMELRPSFHSAEADAEGGGELDAAIVAADQAHPHQELADEIRQNLPGGWLRAGFGLSIKHSGSSDMVRPECPS